MKKYIILLLVLTSNTLIAQVNNSNWSHIGPFSENLENGNLFETSRLNKIAIDPLNTQNMATAGFFGGLWISRNGAENWSALPTTEVVNNAGTDIGFNGVAAIAFNKNHQLYLANIFHPIITHVTEDWNMYSTKLFRYNFNDNNNTLVELGEIPNQGQEYVVYKIIVHPNNDNEIYVGTSIGLFKSTNAGVSWFAVTAVPHVVRDIEISTNALNQTVIYLSGTKILNGNNNNERRYFIGEPLIMRSTDGIQFTELAEFKNAFGNVHNGNPTSRNCPEICVAKVNNQNNPDYEVLFAYTSLKIEPSGVERYSLHRVDINIHDLSSSFHLVDVISDGDCRPHRLAVDFDGNNNRVYYGGVSLRSISNNNIYPNNNGRERWGVSSLLDYVGQIHYDIQDIVVSNDNIFVASDGGINKGFIPLGSLNWIPFEAKNFGLNVSLINGFSGASQDPNYYLIGLQDIVRTQMYDQKLKKNRYTHYTWENDGGLINSVNNNIVISDRSSYPTDNRYYLSVDGGQNLGQELTNNNKVGESTFGFNTYYQDPYRGRMYFGGLWQSHILEFKPSANLNGEFQKKMRLGECPSLVGDWSVPKQMTFSRKDRNKIHVLNRTDDTVGPKISKYIGANFDAANTCIAADWQDITPKWADGSNINFSYNVIPLKDIHLTSMVSSNLNDDVVYVSCKKIKDNNELKILKYNGATWLNYSDGIPLNESVSSLSIDLESNDCIYAITDNAVYYRNASMSEWKVFNKHWPKTLVKQSEINQLEGTLRAGTYGKGIWKTKLKCPDFPSVIESGIYQQDKIVEAQNITSTAVVSADRYVIYKASENIKLNPGFKIIPSSHVKLYIRPCEESPDDESSSAVFVKAVSVKQLSEINHGNSIEESIVGNNSLHFNVFPNPSDGVFTLESVVPFEKTTLKVYDSFGVVVYSNLILQGSKTQIIDLSNLTRGLYVLTFTFEGKNYSKKVILEY